VNPYTVSRYLREVAVEPAQHPDDLRWQDSALCAQADPDAWYPDEGVPGREAKAVCRRCPAREKCLEWALDGDEDHGIWAGLSRAERRRAAALHERGAGLAAVIADADARWDAALTRAAEHAREAGRASAGALRAAHAARRGAASPEPSQSPQPQEAAA
jgi:WhiB family redox-sensing transcriptional regulator